MKPASLYIGLLIGLTLIATSNIHAQPKNLKPGDLMPEIALPDTSGKVRTLSEQTGKIVLIDFWASWCGPCRKSNPALVKIYDKYRSKDFEIYGVSLDKNTTAWKLAIATDKINWIQVNDDGTANEQGTEAWDIMYIPASFLLDKNGKLVALNPTARQLRSYLKKHLK